jgi:hypothetical protein
VDLDDLSALAQLDPQGWLQRASETAIRPALAAARVDAWARDQNPSAIANVGALRFDLLLPPEWEATGALAAHLAHTDGLTVALVPAPIVAGARPEPLLALHGQPASIQDPTTYSLATLVADDVHPAQVLLALLGVLRLISGKAPAQPSLSPALLTALHACRPENPAAANPAKQLALRLHERIPHFWGTSPVASAAQALAVRYLWLAEGMALASDAAELSRLFILARFPRFWPNATAFVQLTMQALTPPTPEPDLAQTLTQILARRRFTTLTIAPPSPLDDVQRAFYWLEFGEWLALYAAALNNVDASQRVPLQLLFDAA